MMSSKHVPTTPIPALHPQSGQGHQFVIYADACSGVPGALHERTFASVNAVLQRIDPKPNFICFPGDEIKGLVANPDELMEQWRHWFDHEMSWLDRESTLLYHTTGNHTVYDPMSESIYQDVMSHLPQNGPLDQKTSSYWVRRDDLLMVFINTLWLGGGGEGRVETEWLEQTLVEHADASHKLVFGHHPVFSVNGFSGEYQRDIGGEDGRRLWDILVKHDVLAYVCSHILAFDVQVHEGVLQILTAGAGTAHRMPEETEYLHLVQAALDEKDLRYQVLDTDGEMREWLRWPLELPPSNEWTDYSPGDFPNLEPHSDPATATMLAWRFTGVATDDDRGHPQTLVDGWHDPTALPAISIGLRGSESRLCVLLAPTPGRSPHIWTGPELKPGAPFDIQLAIHSGMGPGGLLWRWNDTSRWSSLIGHTYWGVERLSHIHKWQAWSDMSARDRIQSFRGPELQIRWYSDQLTCRRC